MSYQIVYWPGFTGRAEPAILLLEDAEQPYEIVNDVRERIGELAINRPVFAAPVLIDGDIVVSQTSVILEYLGGKLGYEVADNHRIAASELAYNAADIWRETYDGRKTDNPAFLDERFPRWAAVLENSFALSPNDTFFFSTKQPTYVDFLVFNAVTLVEYCWGTPAVAHIEAQPRLQRWVQSMRTRPRVKAYFENPNSLLVAYEAVMARI